MTATLSNEVIKLLNLHYLSFFEAKPFADKTEHPTPSDTRSWSQILVSLLVNINGLARKKGADLADGSDVKAANTWGAIDTPRFNGVIKAGTKSDSSGKIDSLDLMPHLFFVLWDNEPINEKYRVRVWAVRTQDDQAFRAICQEWYTRQLEGVIKSNNFQLHPPRNKNSNEFRNTIGNLDYPLLLEAIWEPTENTYKVADYNPEILDNGICVPI